MSTLETDAHEADDTAAAPGTWSLVANVLADRLCGVGGSETRHGTRHFAPGAKVHVIAAFWGMGGESVVVVGHHRKSKRYMCITMKSAHLTNWRVALVRSPAILARISTRELDGSSPTTGTAREPLDGIAASFAACSTPQPFTTRPPSR